MSQFLRNLTLFKKCLFTSYFVLAFLITTGLFSTLNSYNSKSSQEDLFHKRFKVYQVTATAIINVANVQSNLVRETRRANAGFDEKEITLLVKEQLAALDGTKEGFKEALLAEWLTPVEKKLSKVVLNNFRDYKESCISTVGVKNPRLRMASLSFGISDDYFKELNRSLHDLLDLEEKLSQESSNRRSRSLHAALGNLYPTFESSHRFVHADQSISRQARYQSSK